MARLFGHVVIAVALPGLAGWTAPADASGQQQNVEVVVEHELYAGGQIAAGLDQYLADIRSVSSTSPVATFYNFTVSSHAPEARVLPSGENETAYTLFVCPVRV
jgi:hypothetical protein